MTKYRAKEDISPNVKKGDIVEITDELIPEFKSKLELYNENDGEKVDSTEKTVVTNPSRTDLKARATQLGLDFAPNIPTERLMELVKEAEDKKAAEEAAAGSGSEGEGEADKGGTE